MERKAQKKAIRDEYVPLATSPDIQAEMMKRLKLDGKTEEERMMEKLSMEEEKKGDIML